LRPESRQPFAPRAHVVERSPTSGRPDSSSAASVAIEVPLARAGSHSARCASLAPGLDRVGGDDGAREEGSAGELAAQLFERDAELEEAEALAAARLGDREALQAELLGHLLPHVAVEAGRGLGVLAHLADRPAFFDEAAHDGSKLFLLFAEREIHFVGSPRWAEASLMGARRSPLARYAGNGLLASAELPRFIVVRLRVRGLASRGRAACACRACRSGRAASRR
jgi:hypothetical protein